MTSSARTLDDIAASAKRGFRLAGDPAVPEPMRAAMLDLIRADFFRLLGIAEAVELTRAEIAAEVDLLAARLVHELPS